jgi:hypothetical protein
LCLFGNDNETKSFSLIRHEASEPEEEVEVVASGQAGFYETRYINDLATVMEAAQYFLDHQEKNPSFIWL